MILIKSLLKEKRDENNEKIPYVERLYGMYGQGGWIDYSDFNDLTEYELKGFMGDVFKGSSMPIQEVPDKTE